MEDDLLVSFEGLEGCQLQTSTSGWFPEASEAYSAILSFIPAAIAFLSASLP